VRPVLHGTSPSGQASRGAESSEVVIGRGAYPVTYDRTRPIVEGAYWTLTGRWHCRVRSSEGARPVIARGAFGRGSGASGHGSGVSGRWFDRWGSVTVGKLDAAEHVRSVTTTASDHPEKDPVKG
jgi:hypothetical protein